MSVPPGQRSKRICIDAALLERMGFLARGFPGRTISAARSHRRSRHVAERVVVHIDGVAADEVREGVAPEHDDAA